MKMKEHPILFSTEMVRAILDGRKTQTRRVIKPQPEEEIVGDMLQTQIWYLDGDPDKMIHCPYGQVGDRLWVRETFCQVCYKGDGEPDVCLKEDCERNPIAFSKCFCKWTPSIFMPRWASRITLEITGIRVERVQEISPEDCLSEGIEKSNSDDWKELLSYQYADLWDSINGKKHPWSSNPWVWCLEFKRVKSE
jgi:hypothetical protein